MYLFAFIFSCDNRKLLRSELTRLLTKYVKHQSAVTGKYSIIFFFNQENMISRIIVADRL
jgi:hypothetical protein